MMSLSDAEQRSEAITSVFKYNTIIRIYDKVVESK